MKFKPTTEEALADASLIPDKTTCDFEVIQAEDCRSKNGNEQIKLNLVVYHGEMKPHIFDYLLESMGHKLLHFCEAVGLTKQYAAGTLCAADCKHRGGKALIRIEQAKDGYPAKNKVGDYISHRGSELPAIGAKPVSLPPKNVSGDKGGDDVPF